MMSKRMIFPLFFGIAGAAVLFYLGVWQLQRLAWKEAAIARIETRLAAPPVALPDVPDAQADNYLSVALSGELSGDEIHVFISKDFYGPGYRVVSRLRLKDRDILVDLGFIVQADKDKPRPTGPVTISGNLLWPDELDPYFTPDPDLKKNIWLARDLPAMAAQLKTDPVLVVARRAQVMVDGQRVDIPAVTPWPVTANIPNSHLEYAITWFLLGIAWLGMTGYLLWRIRQKTA
jgi:surfeit locus 1 family protein